MFAGICLLLVLVQYRNFIQFRKHYFMHNESVDGRRGANANARERAIEEKKSSDLLDYKQDDQQPVELLLLWLLLLYNTRDAKMANIKIWGN